MKLQIQNMGDDIYDESKLALILCDALVPTKQQTQLLGNISVWQRNLSIKGKQIEYNIY